MNTESPFTQSPSLQSRHSTASPIIMIKRPTQNQQLLPRQNATNSQLSETPTGVVNLAVQSNIALLMNCLNSALSQFFNLPLWQPYRIEINMSKPNRLKFQWGQNRGHQQLCQRTPFTETSFQRHWHSIGILSHQDIQQHKVCHSKGSFSDLKWYQTLKPPRKYGSQMPSVERSWRWSHSWNHQSVRHFHELNERQHALQKSQRRNDGLPPGFPGIQSKFPHTHYFHQQNPSLLFHTFRTHSYR